MEVGKRKLGKTGIMVGELGLAYENFSNLELNWVAEILEDGYATGINFVNVCTANPKKREKIGNALEMVDLTNKYIIEGHIGTIWKNDKEEKARKKAEIAKSFSNLLKNLKREYIDIGILDSVNNEEDFEEVFNGDLIKYAKDMQKAGKIKHIGASTHNPIIAKKMVEEDLIDVLLFSANIAYDIQPPSENPRTIFNVEAYSELEFELEKTRKELYELCEKKNIAITVMECFARGDLLNEELSPFEIGFNSSQCINYALSRPGVKSVMLGVSNIIDLLQAYKYNEIEENGDFSIILKDFSKGKLDGKCVYCNRCAKESPCTMSIDIASIIKYTELAKTEKEIPEPIRRQYIALDRTASDCVRCKKCIKNCHMKVDIVAKLDEAVRIFGR